MKDIGRRPGKSGATPRRGVTHKTFGKKRGMDRMRLLCILYCGGYLATFSYLCLEDWQRASGFFSLLCRMIMNEFLALIWPLYWGTALIVPGC
jgi:hypothetical protein